MAPSKNKSKSKPKAKAKKAEPKKTKAEARPAGDSVRMLAPKAAVSAFIKSIVAYKNQTSTIGGDVSDATKTAKERGVNVPAARIVERIYKKALHDPAKARVLYEDLVYYLECMEFDDLAPPGMFDPKETRSTKSSRKKKGEQLEMKTDAEPEPEAPPPTDADEREADAVVH